MMGRLNACRRFLWPGLVIGALGIPPVGEGMESNAIDELLGILAQDKTLAADRIESLPAELYGPIVVVGEYDFDTRVWLKSAHPEEFGRIDPQRIEMLGHAVGATGFVRAVYSQFTDRRVVSYTGVTDDKRLSLMVYDDAQDREHLVITVRIGPRQLRYLALRPAH